jgi:hypothetical protein
MLRSVVSFGDMSPQPSLQFGLRKRVPDPELFMPRPVLGSAVLAVFLFPASASALCDFNLAPSKQAKVSLVRAYAVCPYSNDNTQTDGGTGACAPVAAFEEKFCSESTEPCEDDSDCPAASCGTIGPFGDDRACVSNADCTSGLCTVYGSNTCVTGSGATTYKFDPKGGCTLSVKAKLVEDCSTVPSGQMSPLQPGACHVTYLTGKCRGVLRADDARVEAPDDNGWHLKTLTRVTFAQPLNGDMTQIDFPVTFAFSDPAGGSFSLKANSAAALTPLVGTNNADLPTCTQIEFLEATLRDPQGRVFARPGVATLP